MNVNERIARALGWLPYRQANPQIDWASMPDYSAGWGWQSPEGKREAFVPDYAHSLDACLPVLADLEAKGWTAMLLVSGGTNVADMQHFNAVGKRDAVITKLGDSPAAVLAECLADALEAK